MASLPSPTEILPDVFEAETTSALPDPGALVPELAEYGRAWEIPPLPENAVAGVYFAFHTNDGDTGDDDVAQGEWVSLVLEAVRASHPK